MDEKFCPFCDTAGECSELTDAFAAGRREQARVDREAFEGAYLEAGQEYGLSADRVYCLTSRALAAVAPEAK